MKIDKSSVNMLYYKSQLMQLVGSTLTKTERFYMNYPKMVRDVLAFKPIKTQDVQFFCGHAGISYDSWHLIVEGEEIASIETKDGKTIWTRHVTPQEAIKGSYARQLAHQLREATA